MNLFGEGPYQRSMRAVIREDPMLRTSPARRAGVVAAGAIALLAVLSAPATAAPPAPPS